MAVTAVLPATAEPGPLSLAEAPAGSVCYASCANRVWEVEMLRNFVAVVAGMIVGMVVNMALVMLNGYVLFPMPDGLDMNDVAGMNAYIQTLPTAAFVVVLAAHLGQSFVGG